MTRMAIVGGGPGGLMTARLFEQQLGRSCSIRLFEAGARLGGKLHTPTFRSAPVAHEAGIAECYDFHHLGPDPLWDLVHDLGLRPAPTRGTTVVLEGHWLRDDEDIRRCLGRRTGDAIEQFRREATAMLPLSRWRQDASLIDSDHPWARRTWADVLTGIADPMARRYVEVTSHSDLATEPDRTNGLVGLRTFLRSLSPYGAQYTIDGGMQALSGRLRESLSRTRIELHSPAVSVARSHDGRYRLHYRRGAATIADDFDAIVVATPYSSLRGIHWAGERLGRAMKAHIDRYDQPGHYLRVSMLFDRPFWRSGFCDSFMMLDAFDGCCLYDESALDPHRDGRGHGVLGWLLAGASAASLAGAEARQLGRLVVDALPRDMQEPARRHAMEVSVNRWIGVLSGVPGGGGRKDSRPSLQPEPIEHPGLVMVGDYFYESTLNGVLRSAQQAAQLVAAGLDRSAA